MSRLGFTLIELMIVLVLLALLMSITTKVSANKSAAAMAVMKSDLRNLATAQEAYFATYLRYADDVGELDLTLSHDITAEVRGNQAGWSARTSHTLRSDWRCAMFLGSGVEPHDPATVEGILSCQPKTAGSGCFGG